MDPDLLFHLGLSIKIVANREQSKRLCNLYNIHDDSDLQLTFSAKDGMEKLREVGFQHFTILDDHDMIWYTYYLSIFPTK